MDRFSCFNFCFLIWDYPCNHWDKKSVLPLKNKKTGCNWLQTKPDWKNNVFSQIKKKKEKKKRGKHNLLVCSIVYFETKVFFNNAIFFNQLYHKVITSSKLVLEETILCKSALKITKISNFIGNSNYMSTKIGLTTDCRGDDSHQTLTTSCVEAADRTFRVISPHSLFFCSFLLNFSFLLTISLGTNTKAQVIFHMDCLTGVLHLQRDSLPG